MFKKIISLLLLCATVMLSLASCSGLKNSDETATSGVTESQTNSATKNPSSLGNSSAAEKYDGGADVNAEKISVYTENFKLTNADMLYIVTASYANFVSTIEYYGIYYGISLESLGLDTSKSIKDQECTFDEFDGSWYDYFYRDAKTTVDEMLAVCEAAKAAGHTMTADEEKQIEDALAEISENAKEANLTVDAYLEETYATGITSQVVTTIMEYSLYATSYLTKIQNDADVSDAALEAKYNENPNAVDTVDFILCSFDYNDLIPEDADDEAKEEAKNRCRTLASEIAKATTEEEFVSKLKEALISDFGQTAEEAEESVAAITYKGQSYSEDVVLDWAFGDIAAGNTKVFEDEETSMVAACFFIGRNGKSEAPSLRDVYHILFSSDTYEDDSVVNKVYNDWVANGASLEEFKTLASKYTEDPGSQKTGGLYEDVEPNQMVAEFNDWLFDPARQVGDHGIVITQHGWHIMYAGEGEGVQWKDTVTELIRSEAVSAVQKSSQETYKVTYDEEIIATLPM